MTVGHLLVKCDVEIMAAIQDALQAFDCRCEVNTDPWAYQRKHYTERRKKDEEFRIKENDRVNQCLKKKYKEDPAYREKRNAADRERYQRKKMQQQQSISV